MKQSRGFTLIEIVVFIAIFSVFFIAATSTALITMRNARMAQETIVANQVVQEGIDYMQSLVDADWNNAIQLVNTSSLANDPQAGSYCIKDIVQASDRIDDGTTEAMGAIPTYTNGVCNVEVTRNVGKTDVKYTRTADALTIPPDTTNPDPALQRDYTSVQMIMRATWTTMGKTKTVSIKKTFVPLEN